MAEEGPVLIASVQRAFRLMEAVGAHEGGAPAQQLAQETGLPLATTHYLLRTLAHDGYLRRLEDGGYVLGERLDTLHSGGREQTQLSRVRPALASLRDDLSAAVYLTFFEDGEIRVADIVDSPLAPRVDLWVGFEDSGHATALGKCLLRELGDESRNDYLSRHPLADLTPHTITGCSELIQRLEISPRPPIVTDMEEYTLGTYCVAVPVFRGQTLGALGVSLRVDRLSYLNQVRDRLIPAAKRVTRGLSLTM
ncbi:IclR family transcriptional regulator [Streptomyces chattanoogensis]|uniref:Glycerol operon regulatory protein n=1 Tax=Streptomyces chattanoogensis TaxID=66876 RepID=A0A0N0GX09_9ACTN|nr:IclR family transcriptional regulator C-terminal domain-containing protein [Streptomyces chattanoogensis]KPC60270.1 transcriptional regulator [Streptomyces chattanoogensis]